MLLGFVQTSVFWSFTPLNSWQPGVLAAGLVVSMGIAWVFGRRRDVGNLQWDGEAWRWSTFSQTGDCFLHQHLDFQSLLLISLRRRGTPTVWLWLERRHMPLHWLALRRAIVHTATASSQRPASGVVPAVPR